MNDIGDKELRPEVARVEGYGAASALSRNLRHCTKGITDAFPSNIGPRIGCDLNFNAHKRQSPICLLIASDYDR